MSTIIFPGRFQPFHNGHLMVVQGMVKVSDNVVIVICDGKPNDDGDMFTLDQRREMVGAALLSADIMDVTIAVVKDAESDEAWATHVLDAAGNPSDVVVWSGNEDVRNIFEAKGTATKKIVPVPGLVGAEIRKLITDKNPAWRSKIPAGAVDVVEEIVSRD
jgi:nicotinamide-nucleotide adenylyltransferase